MKTRNTYLGALAIVAIAALAAGAAKPAEVLTAEQIAYELSAAKGVYMGRKSVNLPAVKFEYNSFTLTSDARVQLNELAKVLKSTSFKEKRFEIAGHTDAKGSDEYNMGLAQKRAKIIVGYLVTQHSVPNGRLDPIGYGKRRLLLESDPYNADNRRAEVVLLQ